jgi:hypothetical protein
MYYVYFDLHCFQDRLRPRSREWEGPKALALGGIGPEEAVVLKAMQIK